jgi:cyclase
MSLLPRVIPVLTFRDRLLVKPTKFGDEKYIGDPVNAVRIFNEKQVDEIVFVDLGASEDPSKVDLEFLEEMASEAFMPAGYGGGVNSASLAREITALGIEKVLLNSALSVNRGLISEISSEIGSQSTVVSIDVRKKRFGGYETYTHRGTQKLGISPTDLAQLAVAQGAGEIVLQSIDRESTFQGYDLKLLSEIVQAVDVPIVALGGASGMDDFRAAINAGASAVAAGSNFVLQGKHRAVLITYPTPADIRTLDES